MAATTSHPGGPVRHTMTSGRGPVMPRKKMRRFSQPSRSQRTAPLARLRRYAPRDPAKTASPPASRTTPATPSISTAVGAGSGGMNLLMKRTRITKNRPSRPQLSPPPDLAVDPRGNHPTDERIGEQQKFHHGAPAHHSDHRQVPIEHGTHRASRHVEKRVPHARD